jgi:hypothetical protein
MLQNMQRKFCKCSLLRFWIPYLIHFHVHLLQLKIYYCINAPQLVQYTMQQTIFPFYFINMDLHQVDKYFE